MYFSLRDIENFEQRYRGRLINCLSGVKSANLIGTIDKNKQTNLAIVSSVVHLGANPALIGFVQRPTSVERHTYENILTQKEYTINAVTSAISNKAHQTAARYPKSVSEFEAVGLTAEFHSTCAAPFVKESPLKLHIKLEEILPISLNQTKFIIGSIQGIFLPDAVLLPDGHLALEKLNLTGVLGLDTYVSLQKEARYSYAKPDQPLKTL